MERRRSWLRASHEEDGEDFVEKRLNLRERKRIKYISVGIDEDEENQEKEKYKQEGLTSGLLVVCGGKTGLLDVKELEKGKACIRYQGHLLTPPAFECIAGKGTFKKWKASISYKKKPLQFWFKQGYLSTIGYKNGPHSRGIRRLILPLNDKLEKLSNARTSDIVSGEETEPENVKDYDWSLSDESDEEEAQGKEEERKEGGKADVNRKHGESDDEILENWDTDDDDVTDISEDSGDQTDNKEEDDGKLIASTREKLGLQKEVEIILKRLPMPKRACRSNCMEHLHEDDWIKSLDEEDFEEMTDDSSATMDEQAFTSIKLNLPSQTSEAAKPDTVGKRQDQQKGIKTETPSDEDEEDGHLKMHCGNINIRKREHVDVSTSQYNIQSRAAEEGALTEKIFHPTLSRASNSPSVLVHQNHTRVPTELQGVMSNMCTPQTSLAVHIAEASAGASSASQEELMDLEQLKREKIQMQLRVLKLQEEYYSLKLIELKRKKSD